MTKYKTQDLLDQLKIRGSNEYAFAAGYLASMLEAIPYALNLNAKQEKAFRIWMENHTRSVESLNLQASVQELKQDLTKLKEMV